MKTKKILFTLLFLVAILGIAGVAYAAEDFTDFSNAKYETIMRTSNTEAKYCDIYDLKITGITKKNGHLYYYAITKDQVAPEIDSIFETNNIMSVDNDSAKINFFEKYLELDQDIYLWIAEKYTDENLDEMKKMVVEGVKIEKPELPKYTDYFSSTFVSKESTQIIVNVPWASETTRKMRIKLGEITDVSLLKKIKNNESGCFQDLLTYAKNASGANYDSVNSYTKSLTAGISTSIAEEAINIPNIKNDVYYYLYVALDGENGKYVESEGVSLGIGTKMTDYWSVGFLGTDDFSWKDFEEKPSNPTPTPTQDPTTAPGKIPQTGDIVTIVASVVVLFGIVAVVTVKKNRKLKGIK